METIAKIVCRAGVVADTHVPDRVRALHPALLPGLKAAGVEIILHAGDICAPWVLDELAAVAPVRAVLGNRDILLRDKLPLVDLINLGGVPVALMHGHGGFWHYWRDKIKYIMEGYKFSRYHKLLLTTLPQARVVVFGHTHRAENHWMEDKLLFNPGTASGGTYQRFPATYGLLTIYEGGSVKGEIIWLDGEEEADNQIK
jgi:putative phosphoesterase